jgi:hypothetical protein
MNSLAQSTLHVHVNYWFRGGGIERNEPHSLHYLCNLDYQYFDRHHTFCNYYSLLTRIYRKQDPCRPQAYSAYLIIHWSSGNFMMTGSCIVKFVGVWFCKLFCLFELEVSHALTDGLCYPLTMLVPYLTHFYANSDKITSGEGIHHSAPITLWTFTKCADPTRRPIN